MEIPSQSGRAHALALLAGGDERAFARAAAKLLDEGEDALALELVRAGLQSFAASRELEALRHRALEALRARSATLDPFKFIVYSEMSGAELPPLAEPGGPVAVRAVK
jgi:hypothetical protein